MIDFIYYIANSFLLPILIAVITFYITKHFDKKKEIPRILLVHIEHGINIHEKIYNVCIGCNDSILFVCFCRGNKQLFGKTESG